MTLDAQQRNPPTHACSLLSLIVVLINDTDVLPRKWLPGFVSRGVETENLINCTRGDRVQNTCMCRPWMI